MENSNRLLLTVVLTLNSCILFCQPQSFETNYYGTVKDKITSDMLKYANIGIKNCPYGTVSDQTGSFRLRIPDSIIFQGLTFSHIGYKELTLDVAGFDSDMPITVELQPELYTLPEAIVLGNYLKTRTRGLRSKSRSMVLAISGSSFGSEVGSPIRLRQKETILNTFHMNFAFIGPDSALFRLKLYEIHNDSIGKSLLNSNIIFKIRKANLGEYKIDLMPHNIMVYSDVFVSLELLSLFPFESLEKAGYGDRINASIGLDLNKGGIFRKDASFSEWEKIANRYSLGIWLTTIE